MPPAAVPFRTEPHAEYRRRARRIRSVYRAQPAVRMRALRELARTTDEFRITPVPTRAPAAARIAADPIVPLPAGAAQSFAALIRERMDGPVLRYSHRTRLLRAAERSGIRRFEANLIIAAVQHEAGATKPADATSDSGRAWIPAALAVAATQSLIVIAGWWIVG